jgi:hypothetical protein
MERPDKGCCGTCGYLAKRVKVEIQGERSHSIFAEVEPPQRDQPQSDFTFVPGEANAWKPGEFGCYRHEVDLPREIRDHSVINPNDATASVIWRDRHCPRWTRYEPGLSPRDHLLETRTRDLEDNRRRFETTLANFGGRLTKAAIWFALIIGLAQIAVTLLTMTSESIAYPPLHAAYYWLRHLFR